MPGRTAWFGLMESGRPRPGDILVVSGAAGAVGLIVAQLGKAAGCVVIGTAGSQKKCDMLTSAPYNLDHALNYKEHDTEEKMLAALQGIAPRGIDIYFDNVGGHVTDAIMSHLALRARVVICGQISMYESGLGESGPPMGPRFLHQLIYKRATIQGILSRDYAHRIEEQINALKPMMEKGLLTAPETFIDGFDQLPQALHQLFVGANVGKLIVRA